MNPGPRRSKLIARSRTGLVVNPSIALGHILWVEQRGRISYLRLRRISHGPVRTLATLRGPNRDPLDHRPRRRRRLRHPLEPAQRPRPRHPPLVEAAPGLAAGPIARSAVRPA